MAGHSRSGVRLFEKISCLLPFQPETGCTILIQKIDADDIEAFTEEAVEPFCVA